jgi:hypothetical protein
LREAKEGDKIKVVVSYMYVDLSQFSEALRSYVRDGGEHKSEENFYLHGSSEFSSNLSETHPSG